MMRGDAVDAPAARLSTGPTGHGGSGTGVLIIKAKGGFGNRILSAATGVALADITGRAPVIDWRDGMYLPAGTNAYPLLFEAPEMAAAEDFDGRIDVWPPKWAGRLSEHPVDMVEAFYPTKHSSPLVYRRLSLGLRRPHVSPEVAVFWSYLPKFARLRRQLKRDPRFRGMSDADVARSVIERYFTPNGRVRAAVAELFADRGRPVIGVHVRYTDRKAPLDAIEARVADLRKRIPQAAVFLATDSALAQQRMVDRFSDVIVIDKVLAQEAQALHVDAPLADPLAEAENALIDMWALASCDWLVHTRHSTFSVAAGLIGGIPLDRQIDVDRYNPRVVTKRWIQAYA